MIDKFKVLELMARNRIESQTELAKRIGVTRQSLSNWLTGKDKPTATTVSLPLAPTFDQSSTFPCTFTIE